MSHDQQLLIDWARSSMSLLLADNVYLRTVLKESIDRTSMLSSSIVGYDDVSERNSLRSMVHDSATLLHIEETIRSKIPLTSAGDISGKEIVDSLYIDRTRWDQ